MSETAILNKKAVHFDSQSEGEGPGLIAENSKSPSINTPTTSLNEESEPSASVPVKGKLSDETRDTLVALFRDFLDTAPDPVTSNHIDTQRNKAGRNRLFGLNKGLSPETGSNNRYDYEQKYPRDRFGKETADNARVWLTYLDEAESFDRERVEGWKETADVLLVFAGLFSGVITTFVSQASQSLQPDNTQVSVSLLFETNQILRAQFSGIPISHVPNPTLTPTSPFIPSTNAFLVNGLWFTSLAITLSTALFAVLAKQWLYYYLTSINGTAREKVRARQLRFKGFELWKVGAIVDLLPILLHLAVGIFLTGIIILLFPLDIRVAWTIVAITGITYTLYFISVILPIRYPECPYTTSLTIYVGILFFVLRETLRWISPSLDKGFQAVWRRINFQAVWRRIKFQAVWRRIKFQTLDSLQRLLYYIHGLSRFLLDLCLVRLVRRKFRTLLRLGRAIISTDSEDEEYLTFTIRRVREENIKKEFPTFTNWREENIKKAVENAAFLDFEALDWLYATSPNTSVRRIIARCVAVHPSISQQFESPLRLWWYLEVNEANLVDLHYCLCLDLLVGTKENWCLLRSIPDVVENHLDEGDYRSYSRIADNVINDNHDQILNDAINDNLELPLIMWRYFLKRVPWNARMAAHILIYEHHHLFSWKYDPTHDTLRNAGVVSFRDINKERVWWKFDYLFFYFRQYRPHYSLDKTFEIRYLLFITIYYNLTSDDPLIPDKERRHQSLLNLFQDFYNWLHQPNRHISPKQFLAFFKDICCADAFWSESMTDDVRLRAVECLDNIWDSMDPDMVIHFPFTEFHDLSLIYQWYSRDLHSSLSRYTLPMFTLLLVPQNRQHLCTFLLNDPDAVSHFSKSFQNLRNYFNIDGAGIYTYPILMDLFKSVNPKMPLFPILYNSSVLVQLWKLLVFSKLDVKKFFLLVKSKLDQEKLVEFYVVMTGQVRSDDLKVLNSRAHPWDLGYDSGTDILDALERSAREFGQIIGFSHLRAESTTEQSSVPEGAANRNHDIEERAQVSDPSKRHSVADWIKQGSVWSRTRIRGTRFTPETELQDL